MENELYDIYAPWFQPFWESQIFYIYSGAAAILLLMFIIWIIVVGFSKKEKVPFWKIALNDLNALKDGKLISENKYKEFYFTLTRILKKYLSKRYNNRLESATDEEVLIFFKNEGFPKELLLLLNKILKGAVFIKFAKEHSSKEHMKQDLDSAILIINKTAIRKDEL